MRIRSASPYRTPWQLTPNPFIQHQRGLLASGLNQNDANPQTEPSDERDGSVVSSDNSEDEDDETIIGVLVDSHDLARRTEIGLAPFGIGGLNGPSEELRRAAVEVELERRQKSNFFHFLGMCLVPTSLMVIVLIGALQEEKECIGASPNCSFEPREFFNAFTRRCICEAVVLPT